MQVFGCAWKINFPEMLFSWPCVLVGLTRKWFKMKIFTSNHFRTHAQREREITPKSRHEPRAQSPSTSHPSTSTSNHTQIAPFDFAEIAPQDRTEIAIEKWLGFDEFDRIWWIFFGWVLFLCLSIEKWYYIFVWKLRKCEKIWGTRRKCVFYIIFSYTTKH